ncbi:hypothetical protein JAAARDRAFT_532740 [Jaapia argillacea MUCL 33604]|uniref:Uncharacterized protein n=1 Tax=Jaapia argillacea MUCL 33604 TaxID=933084 RepID=A0A067P999_9AGAM|nr:hypothetical protein JAAARDRAFT_532740 [Jaapia argillacea MUCL 33604]
MSRDCCQHRLRFRRWPKCASTTFYWRGRVADGTTRAAADAFRRCLWSLPLRSTGLWARARGDVYPASTSAQPVHIVLLTF